MEVNPTMAGAVTRWDPYADLAEMRDRFDRFFGQTEGGDWIPAIDLVRHDGDVVVRADVPGMKPEEIRIDVEDGVLTLSGSHEESKEETDEHYVRRERRSGSFSRSMALPQGVDPKAITAVAKDGVLEVTIPMPEPAGEGKVSITPKAGD